MNSIPALELHRGIANTGTGTWQSARTGNELHRGSANTGMGTSRCPILELNRARTGIGTVFRVDGTMALDQPKRGEDDQSAPTNNNQKALEWRRSFGVGRWQWRGGAAAEEGGAVRTQRFFDVATSRGQWCRISPSEARTISIDTDKQQSAS
jgi:hypothetical protein